MSQQGPGQLSMTNNMNMSAAELRNVHTEWGTDQSSLMLVQVKAATSITQNFGIWGLQEADWTCTA